MFNSKKRKLAEEYAQAMADVVTGRVDLDFELEESQTVEEKLRVTSFPQEPEPG